MLDQFAVFEKPNIAQMKDFCLSMLGVRNVEVLAGSECKEDAEPC